MKKPLLYFLFSMMLYSCGQDTNRIIDLSSDSQKVINDTIPLSKLSIVKNDSLDYEEHYFQGLLFNGWAVEKEKANDGVWSFVYEIKDGVIQRMDVYGVNNYRHRFVEMKNGKAHHTIMFHRNGNKYLEEYYDSEKNPVGIWRRWDASGKLEKEIDKGQNK